ncbi:glutamate-5-semialdehyde dehydrogenase [Candidatus Methylomirabilis limnetica]|uniref:Gamma-glutamyl phosphate reductase n=1 Tax=Candidatus Methylomirabilis limnetica TaxID=2033718 RepID=A0A2T4TXV6_9BACT|nr:glutamate-5-semialdehyde dehydrogenase [Candidatus Methylomirabilis limnetica]
MTMQMVRELGEAAHLAARALALVVPEVKNRALMAIADALWNGRAEILSANEIDLAEARLQHHSSAVLDRLALDERRIEKMAAGVRQVAALSDPVGEITRMWPRPNGLLVGRMRVPLGVIGVIYEARPGVTADAAALCLKSGNAVILKGGREAIRSNRVISSLLADAAMGSGLPKGCVAFIDSVDREAVTHLLQLSGLVDLIIPRGGEELIRAVQRTSTIPILAHDKGLCHTYVDEGADLVMAEEIAFNAKVDRPGVCNAMESLLVHERVAPLFLPRIVGRLQEAGVEIRGCPRTRALVQGIVSAAEVDWDTEYLDLILSVKVVGSFEEAVAHIAAHGSGLAEAIVTADHSRAMRFLREVDAGAVFVNASTRFTDGGEFGMGAEMGISTQKLHARGPVGLTELTCEKFIVMGDGQVRDSTK